jgi:hypothetical protein
MDYPSVALSVDKEDLDSSWQYLHNEYKRFKNILMTGGESNVKAVLQMIKETFTKPSTPSRANFANHANFGRSLSNDSSSQMETSDYQEDMNRSQMFDMSNSSQIDPMYQQTSGSDSNVAAPGSAKRKKKKKKDKHGKKKKKEKYRALSDEDDDEEDEDEDDDDNMDPDYC